MEGCTFNVLQIRSFGQSKDPENFQMRYISASQIRSPKNTAQLRLIDANAPCLPN